MRIIHLFINIMYFVVLFTTSFIFMSRSVDIKVYPCCRKMPRTIFKYGRLQSKLGLKEDIVEHAKYFCISSFMIRIDVCISILSSRSDNKKELFVSNFKISISFLHISSLSFLYLSQSFTLILHIVTLDKIFNCLYHQNHI
jgi:hypothetical protein